ncbi:MAG: hypothetical protein ACRDHE_16895, partial [Ktedonobacterales bacterium]
MGGRRALAAVDEQPAPEDEAVATVAARDEAEGVAPDGDPEAASDGETVDGETLDAGHEEGAGWCVEFYFSRVG